MIVLLFLEFSITKTARNVLTVMSGSSGGAGWKAVG